MRGMTLNELVAWSPPIQRYIIDHGILVPQTKLVIFGHYETWKSMLSIHLAYCIANGTPWFGFRTAKTPTYVLQSEIPQAQVRERVIKLCMGNKVSSEQVWFATEPYIKLDKGFGVAELDKELTRTQAKVLIIDPVFKFMSGRLTDEYDMRQLFDRIDLNIIDRHKVTPIIIHHPRKSIIFEGQATSMGGDDLFGSYLQNWADTIIRTETTNVDGELVLTFEKVRHNHLEKLEPIRIQISKDTLRFERR